MYAWETGFFFKMLFISFKYQILLLILFKYKTGEDKENIKEAIVQYWEGW